MLEVDRVADLAPYVGQALGTSGWVTINQKMIDTFADATGDHQWIHVDVQRAKREMPEGRTIAHGYLTLSLLPRLAADVSRIRQRSRVINYGANRVRFTAPVPSGSRVRLRQVLKQFEPVEGGVRLTYESTIEIEGGPRPALVAETLSLVYD
jgi:acyl dehydratase